CGGKGGHMHLYSKQHLAASSGIVGAGGPSAVGFALAAQYLRPGTIAVAFFGEGAMNQGMLMESINLAATWKLPVLFVCKDDNWSITTKSDAVTTGSLNDRSQFWGVPAESVDGRDVSEVWRVVNKAVKRAREGKGPSFLRMNCVHFEGHFLGMQTIRIVRNPLREMPRIVIPLTKSMLKPSGAPLRERITGLKAVNTTTLSTLRDPRQDQGNDPIRITRAVLKSDQIRLKTIEDDTKQEVESIVALALKENKS
ncbi:thiamine pyrophosphate-dependent enzyme, partial [Candidatus Neomarinimicrobiota bacterium]